MFNPLMFVIRIYDREDSVQTLSHLFFLLRKPRLASLRYDTSMAMTWLVIAMSKLVFFFKHVIILSAWYDNFYSLFFFHSVFHLHDAIPKIRVGAIYRFRISHLSYDVHKFLVPIVIFSFFNCTHNIR